MRTAALLSAIGLLGGCGTIQGLGAGEYSDGKLTKRSTSAAIAHEAALAVRSAAGGGVADGAGEIAAPGADQAECHTMTATDLAALSATGQAEYLRGVHDCRMMSFARALVAVALGRPTTAVGEVAEQFQRMLTAAEQSKTQRSTTRWGVAKTAVVTAGAAYAANQIVNGFEAIAATAAGTTVVNGLSVGTQSTSNNPSGSEGELGASNTESGIESNQIVIGNGNVTGISGQRGSVSSGGAALVGAESGVTVTQEGVKSNAPFGDDLQGLNSTVGDNDGFNPAPGGG